MHRLFYHLLFLCSLWSEVFLWRHSADTIRPSLYDRGTMPCEGKSWSFLIKRVKTKVRVHLYTAIHFTLVGGLSAFHLCAHRLPMIGSRHPSGLNFWSLVTAATIQLRKDLSTMRAEPAAWIAFGSVSEGSEASVNLVTFSRAVLITIAGV